MAEQIILTNVSRSTSYPQWISISAPNSCGTITLKLDPESYTEQMIFELPTITINIYTLANGEYSFFESRALCIDSSIYKKPITSVITDIPTSCILSITPNFDNFALLSHNNTSAIFSEDVWEDFTKEFPLQLIWDNSNVDSGGSGSSESGTGIAVMELPEASESLNGNIVQYVGNTTPKYHSGYFYKCMLTEDGSYDWVAIPVQSATSGGTSSINDSIAVNIPVGGISSGTIIPSGTEVESILRTMLVTYKAPGISLSLNPGTSLYKKGSSITPIEMVCSVTKNSNSIQNIIFSVNGTTVKTLTESVNTGGVFKYTYSLAIQSDSTFQVSATDGIQTSYDSRTIKFIVPYYYGVSDTDTITSLEGMTELLHERGSQTVVCTSDNQYIFFIYDSTYPELTSILDDNGFENINSFRSQILSIDGTSYRVYISSTPVTCSNFEYTFK